jgi:hypothetical protein
MEFVNEILSHPLASMMSVVLSLATWLLRDLSKSVKDNSIAMDALRLLIAEKFETQEAHSKDMDKVEHTFGRVWGSIGETNQRVDRIAERVGKT